MGLHKYISGLGIERQAHCFIYLLSGVLGTVPAAPTSCCGSAVTSCTPSDCRPALAKRARSRTPILPDQEQPVCIGDSSSSDGAVKAVGKRPRQSPPHSGSQHHVHNAAQQHSDDAQLEAMLACKAVRGRGGVGPRADEPGPFLLPPNSGQEGLFQHEPEPVVAGPARPEWLPKPSSPEGVPAMTKLSHPRGSPAKNKRHRQKHKSKSSKHKSKHSKRDK